MMSHALFAIVCAASAISAKPWDYRLQTVPRQVYFTESNPKEKIRGSIFFLVLEQRTSAEPQPQSLDLVYRNENAVVRTDRLLQPLLDVLDVKGISPNKVYADAEAKGMSWPHAYRLFLSLPDNLSADAVEAKLTFHAAGRTEVRSITIPIQAYPQKTAMIFPFRGKGIISQAGALGGGHRNRSGLYAIDAIGLTDSYAPLLHAEGEDNPRDSAGWGREIIAPAAGTIVFAKNDHVDQPVAGVANPSYFLQQYKNGGDPGNFVVIDHGNGEFSMIAHMQKGSVRVKVGDQVAQGQTIGLLGQSGDTTDPHVHYQLQNGPDWERSDALPYRFNNLELLDRGNYFDAK